MPGSLSYVLVTPARNEAQFIEFALKSLVAQTVLPLKWVIVSDGSTDGTDEVVRRYMPDHPWIELARTSESHERHFAAKVNAFNAGYERVRTLDYNVIVCMDADISFDKDYFGYLLQKLSEDATLGVVGTPFRELSGHAYDYRFVSIEHVSGACQVFRRECFEAIGGYVPIRGGSIDHVAVITARMKGWKTRTFTDKACIHHRAVGTAHGGAMRAKFNYGIKDYAIGNAPLWEFFRSLYQMSKPPFLMGGLALGSGYLWAWLLGTKKAVSPELVAFHRKEQMRRLRKLLLKERVAPTLELYKPPAHT
jgi:poly-beta-1,6-N-acetyl-D-glucosamine synthase